MSENRKTKQQLTDNDPSDRDLALVRYKNRKERRGRPRKWMPGDRVRLQTTITPETHALLQKLTGFCTDWQPSSIAALVLSLTGY